MFAVSQKEAAALAAILALLVEFAVGAAKRLNIDPETFTYDADEGVPIVTLADTITVADAMVADLDKALGTPCAINLPLRHQPPPVTRTTP